MIEAAREYLHRGLAPIPVGNDKRPLVKWEPYQAQLPRPDQVDEWWFKMPEANVGVVTGRVSGVVVLDADGPEGLESLKALCPPATTWLSRTGRGWHQWFAHPGVTIGNRAGLRPHLDVRGDGGYVVAPPSWHASGRRYEWVTGPDEQALATVPENVLALLVAPTGAAVDPPSSELIPEGQRNDRLYRLGRSLVARGLSEAALTVALLEENRTRCRPPLPEDEVRALGRHVITQPDRPLIREAPVVGGPAVPLLGRGLGTFLTLAKTLPAPEPYIVGLLSSDGGGWLGGEEKLGKTYFALDEALGLAMGLPVCGRFPVPVQRRVLFLEEEDSPRRTNTRIRALIRGRGLDPDSPPVNSALDAWFHVAVWEGVTLDDPVMLARLEATIADFRPAVCYLDVLRKLTLRDLNKASEASALLGVLDDLRRKYGVVFRVLHHYRKVQGFRAGRGSQEIGGSFVLGAWAENSLFFEPVGRKQGAVRVEVQTKDGPASPAFRLRFEAEGPDHAPTVMRLLAEEEKATDDADEIVYQAVATLPPTEALAGKPGVTIAALVDAVKRSDKTVRRALKRLEDADRVLVTGQASKRKDLYGVKGE